MKKKEVKKWNVMDHSVPLKDLVDLYDHEWKRLKKEFESPEDLKNEEKIKDYVDYCISAYMENKETSLAEVARAQGRMQGLSEALGWVSIINVDFIGDVVKNAWTAFYIEGYNAPDFQEKIK